MALRLIRASVLMLAVCSSASRALAADDSDFSNPVVAKLNDKVLRFLQDVSQGKEQEAFDELLAGSQLAEQSMAIKQLVEKAKNIVDRYGTHRENEAISAKRVGKDVVLLKYLFKCEKLPVVWHVAYYRDTVRANNAGEDHWSVVAIRFDTQLDALAN
jgi:hypothetical protein